MKPIFGIDVTQNKHNEELNGLNFVVAEATAEQTDALLEQHEGLEETIEKSKLPLWLRILKAICGYLALILGLGMIKSLPEVGLAHIFQRATIFVLCFFFFLIAWIVLKFLSLKKETAVYKERNAEGQIEEYQQDLQALYESLGAPSNADTVDVLSFLYKVKDGEIKPTAHMMQTTPYVNFEAKLFATEDALCLVDTQHCFSFPKAELRAIRKVDERIALLSWNKGDEEPKKGRFKPYKLTVNQYGNVFVKSYYIMELVHDGEEWGIYFPCYEKDAFEKASGLTAEE